MLQGKDPAITLFGKKIPFPAFLDAAALLAKEKEKSAGDGYVVEEEEQKSAEKGDSTDNLTDSAEQEAPERQEMKNDESSQAKSKDGEEDETSKDQNESNNSQEDRTPLKKPTKILPCPRCKSMDTKFCYYNNYNINQPRHFCKACQRYWTAGGNMRNVPVGAGRRKNKNSSSHYRHITISEALQAARINLTHPDLKTNGRVLSFGQVSQTAPICESMSPVFKLEEQNVRMKKGDNCSTGSSITASNNNSKDETSIMKNNNVNGFGCIPSVPWPYTWNPVIPPPPAGFFPPPVFPMPFYPYWSIPILSPQSSSSSSSGPNSPTLRKHSRDEETQKTNEPENAKDTPKKQRNGCILVPKTLRFDDPNDAAKSSIWTTLGIKNELWSKGGMFKGFDQKAKNNEAAEASPVLCANPAALSRSHDFHERI